MRHLRRLICIMTFISVCFTAYTQITYSHKLDSPAQINYIHPFFSKDSKAHLYNSSISSDRVDFVVLDSDCQVEKSFSAQLPQYYIEGNESSWNANMLYNLLFIDDNGMSYGIGSLNSGVLSYSFWEESNDYEYLIPILGNTPVKFNGVVYDTPIIGVAVKRATGGTICEIKFPQGYYWPYSDGNFTIVAMQGKIHAIIPVMNDAKERCNLIYNMGTYSGLNKVITSPKFVSVAPTLIDYDDLVNVTVEGYEGLNKHVEVVSVNGQECYRCDTGDDIIQIPSRLLSRGVNIVTVNVNGENFEATKIIVR